MSETIIGQDNTKLLEGRQLVVEGTTQAGDLLVFPSGETQVLREYDWRTKWDLKKYYERYGTIRVYRKMDVAHNLDRDVPAPFPLPLQCTPPRIEDMTKGIVIPQKFITCTGPRPSGSDGGGATSATRAHNPNVCREAENLVLGDRNESYGSPADDYTKTAKVWSGLLAHKLKPGVEITPKEAVLMMAGMKLSREMHKHKRDNLVDCAGYVLCAEWIQNGEKPFVPQQ